jgi:2,3-bisphosphoglycerate-independent phosphoglycerate mutase
VYQDLTRINKAIMDGELATNSVLQAAFAKARGSRLHLLGLVSDGGVHSHQEHLIALAAAAKGAGVGDIMVHAITDGRDTSPTGGADYLARVQAGLAPSGARIATVIGRYFAMDRDQRWERNKLAWDAIVLGRGPVSDDTPSAAVSAAYMQEPRGDEFLQPIIFSHADEQRVRDGDVVLWFNFRADRARQLSRAFLERDFAGFEREVVPAVHYVTLTEYDETYGCPVVFGPQSLKNILGEVVSAAGRRQLRIAETEKYPHVTFFFNGGVEEPFAGEDRIIVPSPKDVPTYDYKPEMSAPEVTARVVAALPDYDLVILNFANPDMVGHTGVVQAGIKAVETIDDCVRQVVEKTLALGGQLLITADHGNCEQMRNADGSPNTAHTTNLVHLLHVSPQPGAKIGSGILADVAPTLLGLLGVAQPAEMTGRDLLH